jgi:hypothetical protein
MGIKLVCDRCGVQITEPTPPVQWGDAVIMVKILPGHGKDVDYCVPCTEQLLVLGANIRAQSGLPGL